MSRKKEQNKGYLAETAKLAPIFLAKAALGDAPKGLIESTVEEKLRKPKTRFSAIAKRALLKKPLDRAFGASLGVATAYPFIKGVQMAKSSDPKERRKGLALIGGSTVAYQMAKSGKEGFRIGAKGGAKSGMKSAAKLGLLRSGIKLPGAVAMGVALSKSQKDRNSGKKSSSFGPALTGALATGGTRAAEHIVLKTPKGKRLSTLIRPTKLLRRVGPAFAGGAAAGAFGGLVLDKVVDKAVTKMRKSSG